MLKFRFIEDPGHGWLEVPLAKVRQLGIRDKISEYSYLDSRTGMAYLEEDCDYATFAVAMRQNGEAFSLDEEHQDPTFVRDLPSFS